MKSRITAMAKARLFTPRFVFTRIALFVVVVNVAIFYQPNWIYKTFYYNPRWVNDAWWSLSYPAYLLVYASMFVLFVELIIRFIKKYA